MSRGHRVAVRVPTPAPLRGGRDQKALTKEQIVHLDQCHIPNYQWSALDVNSRFKLIAYSREKSWTNGLCFYLWTVSWLRSNGVKTRIVFTVDHGEEFGGKSWLKLVDLRKLLSSLGCRVIQNHKGHCEENAHVERSHRTDDDEFYIPRVSHIRTEQDLLDEALGYIYYYNNVREHSSLDYQTPFAHLKQRLPDINDRIRTVIPVMLDDVAVAMGPWSGYNVLAQYLAAQSLLRPTLTAVRRLQQHAVVPDCPTGRTVEEEDVAQVYSHAAMTQLGMSARAFHGSPLLDASSPPAS